MKDYLHELHKSLSNIGSSIKRLAIQYDIDKLGGPQGTTVYYLWENRHREIFIKDIEKKLGISKSVTSNLIKRMTKNDFVKVIPSKTDKRYKQVVLAEKGLEKSKMLEKFHENLNKKLLKEITIEEFEFACQVFKKIQKSLEEEE